LSPEESPLLAFVAQGEVQPNTFQKIQICDEFSFLGPNSEYHCVNFLAHILSYLISALTTTSFDLTGKRSMTKFAERFTGAAMLLDKDLAVCGRTLRPPQNLTAPQELPMRRRTAP
jgi:hypothetical protein